MKKLLLLFLFALSLFAADSAQWIQAVKQNPALLDTPYGQQMLAAQGLTKEQALQMLQGKQPRAAEETVRYKTPENDLLELNATLAADEEETPLPKTEEKNLPQFHPFTYKTPEELLEEIAGKQQLREPEEVERYAKRFFRNRNQLDPSALAVPGWYRIHAGDTLALQLFGTKNERQVLKVDGAGTVQLPVYGPFSVGGMPLETAEKAIQKIMARVYSNTQSALQVEELSTIQVTVAGEVEAPGIYNVNAISTVKEALLAAGGVTDRGSVREIRVNRGDKQTMVDLYRLMMKGDATGEQLLQAGDTVFIPKASKLVQVTGAVERPGIYELIGDEPLSAALEYAGGIRADADKSEFWITRFADNKAVRHLSVTPEEAAAFQPKDLDRVHLYPIDQRKVEGVSIFGNVAKPGFRPLPEGSPTLGNLLKAEIDAGGLDGFFLEETLMDYALVKRTGKGLEEELLQADLSPLLAGDFSRDLPLMDKDEIYIFNKQVVYGVPFVTIEGENVARPGEYQYKNGMTLRDLLRTAGVKPGTSPDMERVRVETRSYTGADSKSVNLLTDAKVPLTPYDHVYLYDMNVTRTMPTATINGEVASPGTFPIVPGSTTLQDLVHVAGGLTEQATKEKVEIVRYHIEDGVRTKKVLSLSTDQAFGTESFPLNVHDEINIFRTPKWSERQSVTLQGQVKYPGTYVITEGDRLVDVLRRAGGFTDNAFLEGSVFTRKEVQELQTKRLRESLFRLRQTLTASQLTASQIGERTEDKARTVELVESLERQAKEFQPIGRVALTLKDDLEELARSGYNIVLQDGDTLAIPSFNDTVTVIGEVMSTTTVIWDEKYGLKKYLDLAGGLKEESASEGEIFIIHANGMAEKQSGSWFGDGYSNEIRPGDTIVVPPKVETISNLQIAKDVSSILYQFALTAASLNTLGVL